MCKFLHGRIFSFLLGLCLDMKWVGCIVTCVKLYWWIAEMFSKAAAPFISPPVHLGAHFSMFLPHLLSVFLILAILVWSGSHCGFDLHFPNDEWWCTSRCSDLPDSVTPGTALRQASLSVTSSWSLLRLMSIESGYHPTTYVEHLFVCLLVIVYLLWRNL